jgi:hypothetical protein
MNKVHDFNLLYSFFWAIPYEDGKFCSSFIGWINKKNNLEQNAGVFLQENSAEKKPAPIGRRMQRGRLEEQAMEGSDLMWRPVVT